MSISSDFLFHNLQVQSRAIKQTTVCSMRSEHGLSTIPHCLQWYKLLLLIHSSSAYT